MVERSRLTIDGALLLQAQDYYQLYGYEPIATPWLVGEAAYCATLPPGHNQLMWRNPFGSYHVASAEQGFMQLLAEGETMPPMAQSTSPCFRGEPVYDDTHLPCFYKLELYNADTTDESLQAMIACARGLFTQLDIATRVVATGDRTYDIETAETHIELGSYGPREFQGHHWLYGTGLALPRATYARARL